MTSFARRDAALWQRNYLCYLIKWQFGLTLIIPVTKYDPNVAKLVGFLNKNGLLMDIVGNI